MAVNELDLTIKDNWSEANLGLIAQAFGYVSNDKFAEALGSFIKRTVEPATVTQFLPTIAQGYFSSWQPPLERLNSQDGRRGNLFFSSCQNKK